MSSAVAELEAGLQAMLLLKPPGVSGSRIQGITSLCTSNVQSESVLIQKLYTHFKKAPATHKLGVLYVVDSVTRKWTEQAKSAGQAINSSALDGTFAAGVHKVKELLPALMNDIIQSAPDDQKEKIKKLIDIWEKGQTFPAQMLSGFKEKLNAQNPSTTPPGSPPADLQKSLGLLPSATPNPAPAAPNTSSILEALANMARQNTAAPPANPSPPLPVNSYNVTNGQSNPAQAFAGLNQTFPFPVPPPVNVPSATFASLPQGTSSGVQNFASNQAVPFAPPAPIVPPGPTQNALQAQVALIQTLTQQGFKPETIGQIINGMAAGQGLPMLGAGGVPPPPPQFAQNQNQNAQNGSWSARPEDSRDRNGFNEPVRSPPGRFRRRSRSRSPARAWGARDSPNSRRHDDSYEYGRDSPGRNRGDDRNRVRGGGRNDYRQRSPPRRGRSPTPPRSNGHSDVKKWVEHDPSIGRGNIKVLSRTLFVGGVTMPESELRSIFAEYGQVQTCIVNKDKRHAFVKMLSREDAVRAKEQMEKNRAPDSQLRTRWGVGFGPRDCSDYQTGVSIIPISKLTDADRKWMLTAEYGGSGGQPIEGGLVVEEPDIEIGQGVSSKAISRRMQTDKGGNNGPKSSREREEEERGYSRRGEREDRRDDRRDRDDDRAPPSMPPIPPFGMPGFPMGINGMPFFPPGFTFPGQSTASSSSSAPNHNS